MRRLLVFVTAILSTTAGASGQTTRPAHTVAGGYTYVRQYGGDAGLLDSDFSLSMPRGYFISLSERTRWRWDLTLETNQSSGTTRTTIRLPGDRSVSYEDEAEMATLVVGPTFQFRRSSRAVPFVRLLGGLAGIVVPCVQLGGGADLRVTERLGLRLATDYLAILDGGDDAPASNVQAQAGLVVRFGK